MERKLHSGETITSNVHQDWGMMALLKLLVDILLPSEYFNFPIFLSLILRLCFK